MRKVVVSEYVTVDGVFEDLDRWHFDFWHDEIGKYKLTELQASDGLLMGRVTYEGFASTWPDMTDQEGFADRMNSLPKYVASTTLEDATWNNTTVIRENVPEAIADLKQEEGQSLLLGGSAQLANALLRHGLVDELRLLVHPVVFGRGRRLFDEELDTTTLKLSGTTTFATGVVALHYELAPASQLSSPTASGR
jgi:dihydrofolate reductase